MPFVLAACTITATFIAVDVIARVVPMVSYVRNVVELISLGLAVDFSLLVVLRFREELERGLAVERALVRTMETAGRAVLFSGLAVAVGLALLSAVPVPFVRSLGIAGMLVPLAAIAAALTLQPVLLALLGRRVIGRFRPGRATESEGRFWLRLSAVVVRRPVLFLVIGTAVVAAAALPAVRLRLTPAALSSLPSSPESLRGYSLLSHGIGAGAVTPTHVVIDAGPAVPRTAGPSTRRISGSRTSSSTIPRSGSSPAARDRPTATAAGATRA